VPSPPLRPVPRDAHVQDAFLLCDDEADCGWGGGPEEFDEYVSYRRDTSIDALQRRVRKGPFEPDAPRTAQELDEGNGLADDVEMAATNKRPPPHEDGDGGGRGGGRRFKLRPIYSFGGGGRGGAALPSQEERCQPFSVGKTAPPSHGGGRGGGWMSESPASNTRMVRRRQEDIRNEN